jgi:hypothetical protein
LYYFHCVIERTFVRREVDPQSPSELARTKYNGPREFLGHLLPGDESFGVANDEMILQGHSGLSDHGDCWARRFGAIGVVQWFEGNLTVVRGQYQLLFFHKPEGNNGWMNDVAGARGFKFDKLEQLLATSNSGNGVNLTQSLIDDSLKYGYLLPGFSPLHWRANCVRGARTKRDMDHSYSRLDCALRQCKCPKEGHCYYDDLCPSEGFTETGEPFNGLGCFVDENKQPCRECGYGDYQKISCGSEPNTNNLEEFLANERKERLKKRAIARASRK